MVTVEIHSLPCFKAVHKSNVVEISDKWFHSAPAFQFSRSCGINHKAAHGWRKLCFPVILYINNRYWLMIDIFNTSQITTYNSGTQISYTAMSGFILFIIAKYYTTHTSCWWGFSYVCWTYSGIRNTHGMYIANNLLSFITPFARPTVCSRFHV